ncbi:MAG: DUF177 domain-containing protein [Micrococcales bacterium]|nr:DUF177 domain-containing protein [Micrococcales bacterium]
MSVHELARQPGASRQLDLAVKAPMGMGSPVIEVLEGQELGLELLLESVLEGVLASGTVTTEAQGQCVRCLSPLLLPVEVSFQELFSYPERVVAATEAGDLDNDSLQVIDDLVDLNIPVRDAVVLALPFRPLCQDSCPGLCSECGVELAGQVDHTHAKVDPRWSPLEQLAIEREEKS